LSGVLIAPRQHPYVSTRFGRGGRLVMMGSASVLLEFGYYGILANDWRVMGCFMYPQVVPARAENAAVRDSRGERV
jgi:hypothetical protein